MTWLQKAWRGKSALTLVNVLLIAWAVRLPLLINTVSFLFDEAFFVPAARAIIAGSVDIVPEHPQLVKYIIAGSMKLFGDSPLAWRLPSVLAGLAGVWLTYRIAKKLGLGEKLSLVAALIIALDPLHIAFSRVAMLDVFMVTFSLAGFYVMIENRIEPRFRWPLAGALFGLAIASKWPAVLSMAGSLAFIFLAGRWKSTGTKGFLVMLSVAAVTYLLSYVPFVVQHGPQAFIDLQASSVFKHVAMQAHMQTSPPLGWLLGLGTVWMGWNPPTVAVVAMGNPAIWWPSIIAIFAFFGMWFRSLLSLTGMGFFRRKVPKLSPAMLFSVIWFVANWLPWLLLPRAQTFIYYMLPAVPAYGIAIAAFIKKYPRPWAISAIIAAATVSFAVFYPVVIGISMPAAYIDALRWWIGSTPPVV